MQAGLVLQFPHSQRQVPIRIFVPRPEQRPRTAANFAYMCTGELPPPEMLTALGLPPSAVAYRTSEAARTAGGLVPFADTAVVRVEKGVLVEIGASTSRTIFGGFIPDERMQDEANTAGATPTASCGVSGAHMSVAATLPKLKAGTVLCGNIGVPDSHGSRYCILLADTPDHQRVHYAGYATLGMITSGLDALIASANQVPVHARSLEPRKRIPILRCQLDFDYGYLLNLSVPGADNSITHRSTQSVSGTGGALPPRTAGRVRRRDEDEEEVKGKLPAADGNSFFHFDARYPTGANGSAAGPGAAAKRRRAELVTLDENNRPVLRTTAIVNTAIKSEDGGEEEEESNGTRRRFNYFGAQEAAFLNDIEDVKARQQARTHNKMRKLAKSASVKGFGTQSAKKIREKALLVSSAKGRLRTRAVGSSSGAEKGGSGGSSSSRRVGSASKAKKLNRRY